MKIQINTDGNISQSDVQTAEIEATIRSVLKHFSGQLTRVEVHLSDENSSKKFGLTDMRCLLEARPEGLDPVAVTEEAESVERSVDGAARKMRRALDSLLARRQAH